MAEVELPAPQRARLGTREQGRRTWSHGCAYKPLSDHKVRRVDAVAPDVPETIGVADPLPGMLRFLRQMAF